MTPTYASRCKNARTQHVCRLTVGCAVVQEHGSSSGQGCRSTEPLGPDIAGALRSEGHRAQSVIRQIISGIIAEVGPGARLYFVFVWNPASTRGFRLWGLDSGRAPKAPCCCSQSSEESRAASATPPHVPLCLHPLPPLLKECRARATAPPLPSKSHRHAAI